MSDDLHTRITQLETTVRRMHIAGAVVVAAAAMVVLRVLLNHGSPPPRQLTIEGEDGSWVTIEGGRISIKDRGGHLIDLHGESIVMTSGERMLDLSTARDDEGVGISRNGTFARLRLSGDDANLTLSPDGKHLVTLTAGPRTELALHSPVSRASLALANGTPSTSLELDGGKQLQLVATPDEARVNAAPVPTR
jgi:hypothetical protein